jgi:phosphoribosyl 1,2-cyclic phosphodiesterase
MTAHFHVLASGSSGNCSLLEIGGFGMLIDLGLGPRQLVQRFRGSPPLWDRVRLALLTHVHGDHWNENTLNQLVQRRIPLYCHAEHATDLAESSPAFVALADAGLVRHYVVGAVLELGPAGRCEPVALPHDGGLTCGFRFEGPRDHFGRCPALAYAADLGSWNHDLVGRLADVDVLALEFNHDVAMQYQSGRSPHLIRRVLGDRGHLSNAQAAALFAEVLRRSEPGRLRHLVQLHLSRQCNRPELARHVAELASHHAAAAVEIHTAQQHVAGPSLALGTGGAPGPRRRRWSAKRPDLQAPTLFPDWE